MSVSTVCNRSFLDHGRSFLQSAGRTNADALSAGDTSGFDQRFFHVRFDNRVEASVHQTQRAYAHNFVADSDAKTAKDTLVRVSDDERMIIFEFDGVLIACKSFRFDIVLMRKVDQLTFEVVVASAFQTSGSLRLCLLCGVTRQGMTSLKLSFLSSAD